MIISSTDQPISASLRSFLEFESAKHGFDITIDNRADPLQELYGDKFSMTGIQIHLFNGPNTHNFSVMNHAQTKMTQFRGSPVRALVYRRSSSYDPDLSTITLFGSQYDHGELDTSLHVGYYTRNLIALLVDITDLESAKVPTMSRKSADLAWEDGTSSYNWLYASFLSKALAQCARFCKRDLKKAVEDRYVDKVAKGLEQGIADHRESLRVAQMQMEQLAYELRQKSKHLASTRRTVQALESATLMMHVRKARREYQDVQTLINKRTINNFCLEGQVLTFGVPKIRVTNIDDSDEYLYLGPFQVSVNFGDDTIQIHAGDDAPHSKGDYEGYYHPHIGTGGSLCMGNMEEAFGEAIAQWNVLDVINLVHAFLNNYNDESSYVRLQAWDEDYDEEEDRYESCSNDASYEDCAACSDDGCGHWGDEARDRCRENSTPYDCIECGRCSVASETSRQDECRDNHASYECVDCDTVGSCQYQGDEEACWNSVSENGEVDAPHECLDCEATECSHYRDSSSASEVGEDTTAAAS